MKVAVLLSGFMDIRTYRSTTGTTQSALASLLTSAGWEANQSLVSQWERGELPVSAEWCARLEIVTSGKCTRLAIRPDLFGDLRKRRVRRA
jgi:DNA-binding transcriptional regulator YdaS (Cro superfamily)